MTGEYVTEKPSGSLARSGLRSIDRLAAWLMVPYAAWVSFAIVLNVAIYGLN